MTKIDKFDIFSVDELVGALNKLASRANAYYLSCQSDTKGDERLWFIFKANSTNSDCYILKELSGTGPSDVCYWLDEKEFIKFTGTLDGVGQLQVTKHGDDELVLLTATAGGTPAEAGRLSGGQLDKALFDLSTLSNHDEEMDIWYNDQGWSTYKLSEYLLVFQTSKPGSRREFYEVISVLSTKFREKFAELASEGDEPEEKTAPAKPRYIPPPPPPPKIPSTKPVAPKVPVSNSAVTNAVLANISQAAEGTALVPVVAPVEKRSRKAKLAEAVVKETPKPEVKEVASMANETVEETTGDVVEVAPEAPAADAAAGETPAEKKTRIKRSPEDVLTGLLVEVKERLLVLGAEKPALLRTYVAGLGDIITAVAAIIPDGTGPAVDMEALRAEITAEEKAKMKKLFKAMEDAKALMNE